MFWSFSFFLYGFWVNLGFCFLVEDVLVLFIVGFLSLYWLSSILMVVLNFFIMFLVSNFVFGGCFMIGSLFGSFLVVYFYYCVV